MHLLLDSLLWSWKQLTAKELALIGTYWQSLIRLDRKIFGSRSYWRSEVCAPWPRAKYLLSGQTWLSQKVFYHTTVFVLGLIGKLQKDPGEYWKLIGDMCRTGWLFLDQLVSTHPALHTSFCECVFYKIVWVLWQLHLSVLYVYVHCPIASAQKNYVSNPVFPNFIKKKTQHVVEKKESSQYHLPLTILMTSVGNSHFWVEVGYDH